MNKIIQHQFLKDKCTEWLFTVQVTAVIAIAEPDKAKFVVGLKFDSIDYFSEFKIAKANNFCLIHNCPANALTVEFHTHNPVTHWIL